jgi:hypothetical protein
VDGNLTITVNRALLTFPFHQEISITLWQQAF